jgi:hypothetical protein
MRRPEIDSRDERRRDGQNACDQKWGGTQWTIPTSLVPRTGARDVPKKLLDFFDENML